MEIWVIISVLWNDIGGETSKNRKRRRKRLDINVNYQILRHLV